MQPIIPSQQPNASEASFARRALLKLAAAGAAATLPATAQAGPGLSPPVPAPLSDEEQLEACIGQLRSILSRMNPGHDAALVDYQSHPTGGATVKVAVHRTPADWSGPGFYEVESRERRSIDVYWVSREWCEMDRCHHLYAAYYFEGHLIAPREVIRPWQLVRKLEGERV